MILNFERGRLFQLYAVYASFMLVLVHISYIAGIGEADDWVDQLPDQENFTARLIWSSCFLTILFLIWCVGHYYFTFRGGKIEHPPSNLKNIGYLDVEIISIFGAFFLVSPYFFVDPPLAASREYMFITLLGSQIVLISLRTRAMWLLLHSLLSPILFISVFFSISGTMHDRDVGQVFGLVLLITYSSFISVFLISTAVWLLFFLGFYFVKIIRSALDETFQASAKARGMISAIVGMSAILIFSILVSISLSSIVRVIDFMSLGYSFDIEDIKYFINKEGIIKNIWIYGAFTIPCIPFFFLFSASYKLIEFGSAGLEIRMNPVSLCFFCLFYLGCLGIFYLIFKSTLA